MIVPSSFVAPAALIGQTQLAFEWTENSLWSSLGVHLDFFLCENKPSLQVYKLFNWFGPEEMNYWCKNTLGKSRTQEYTNTMSIKKAENPEIVVLNYSLNYPDMEMVIVEDCKNTIII